MTLLDAYDVVAWSEALQAKLSAAFATLSRKQGLKEEKEWLGCALADQPAELVQRSQTLRGFEQMRWTRQDRVRAPHQGLVPEDAACRD